MNASGKWENLNNVNRINTAKIHPHEVVKTPKEKVYSCRFTANDTEQGLRQVVVVIGDDGEAKAKAKR